jgi:hypothetical protein
MEKDYSYSAQVNRRLASTYFLISSCEQPQNKSLSRSEKQAYVDSILLQLYCACVSYCNELLSHHSKPVLASDSFNLIDMLENKKHESVFELHELRLLYNQKECGLFQLCKLFKNMMSIGTKEEQEEKRKQRESQAYNADTSSPAAENNNIINMVVIETFSDDSTGLDLSDLKAIKHLLRTLQELIDRQREYLLEY